jgi:copper chaperone CopZ
MKTTIFALILIILPALVYSSGTVESKLKTITINTYGMHCAGCEETLETELKKLDGVKSVKADHVNMTVTVKYESTKVTVNSIKSAITTAGYKLEKS